MAVNVISLDLRILIFKLFLFINIKKVIFTLSYDLGVYCFVLLNSYHNLIKNQ